MLHTYSSSRRQSSIFDEMGSWRVDILCSGCWVMHCEWVVACQAGNIVLITHTFLHYGWTAPWNMFQKTFEAKKKRKHSNEILVHIWSTPPDVTENEWGGSNMEGSLILKWIKTALKLATFPFNNTLAACHVGASLQSPAISTCWLTFMA